MGQAKQRAAMRHKWLGDLSGAEKVVVESAENLFCKYLVPAEATSMCYRMTFFLHLLLLEKGIGTEPVVGYVNDGTDDVQMSHAWLEFNAKKIDLTLAQTERPDLNPRGQVLILDEVVKQGQIYSYSRLKTERAAKLEKEGLSNPRVSGLIVHKAREHQWMASLATSGKAMRRFLDAAPDGVTFKRLRSIIEA